MIKSLMTAVFGTRFDRDRKRIQPIVDAIHGHEERLSGLSEDELKGQTAAFRARLIERTGAVKTELEEVRAAKHGCADPAERDQLEQRFHQLESQWKKELAAGLDELLPEAYATVREACRRLMGTTVMVTGHDLVWDMVPYDVQLIGGVVLHQGKIAEMATGEGKTLVATLPLYLNALTGRGAHLVTVNNYLARRDSQWMGHVFKYLGLTVACLDDTEPSSPDRRAAYQADITYGTNNEFGFDYLRDNMVFSLEQRVQREHAYAIIDEVDSILIDEARTPLIISGPVGNETDDKYGQFNRQVAELVRKQTGVVNTLLAEAEKLLEDEKTRQDAALKLYQAQLGMPKNKRLLKMLNETGIKQLVQRMELDAIADRKLPIRQQRMRDVEDTLYFVLDEKGHSVHLTDRGAEAMSPNDPELFLVPDISEEIHRIDKDPGAVAPRPGGAAAQGRVGVRHQERKAPHHPQAAPGPRPLREGSGLPGAGRPGGDRGRVHRPGDDRPALGRRAAPGGGGQGRRAGEGGDPDLRHHHDPELLPDVRQAGGHDRHRRDRRDRVLPDLRARGGGDPDPPADHAARPGGPDLQDPAGEVQRGPRRGGAAARPGMADSDRHGDRGRVGDAVAAAQAAGSQARGAERQVSPARGRDRRQRGPEGLHHHRDQHGRPRHRHQTGQGPRSELEEAGLQIIGTERHESRRIDRQLRGRSGRQGDPGQSIFFLSLEDDLMRLFGSDRIARWMDKSGAEEGEVITGGLVTRAIEQAQKRVELQNFQSRKRLLEYDDVMNQQREVVYSLRLFALERGEELKAEARRMIEAAVERATTQYLAGTERPEEYDRGGLREALMLQYLVPVDALTDAEATPTLERMVEAAKEQGEVAFQRKIEYLSEFGASIGIPEVDAQVLSQVMLSVLDERWKDHLYDLDQLRNAIQYRAWGQKDPLVEYKREAFEMFQDLMHDIQSTFTERFLKIQVSAEPPREAAPRRPPLRETGPAPEPAPVQPAPASSDDLFMGPPPRAVPPPPPAPRAAPAVSSSLGPVGRPAAATVPEVGRNDPCPCGSGKKYKKCHGAGR